MAVKCILTGQTPSVLDGVTENVQTQLDSKESKINLTANRAVVVGADGKLAVSAVTSTELGYLDGVTSNIQTQLNSKLSSAPVTSVAGKTGAVTLAKGDVGLGNVDNTSDLNKPISTATQTALDAKQDKITATGLLAGDGEGNVTAAEETEVELVEITPDTIGAQSKITANGILKGDGNGGVSTAVKETDYAGADRFGFVPYSDGSQNYFINNAYTDLYFIDKDTTDIDSTLSNGIYYRLATEGPYRHQDNNNTDYGSLKLGTGTGEDIFYTESQVNEDGSWGRRTYVGSEDGRFYVDGAGNPTGDSVGVFCSIQNQLGGRLELNAIQEVDTGVTINFNIEADTVTGIPTPTTDDGAANKAYVDSKTQGTALSVTLAAASWTGDSAPYTYTVSNAAITATSTQELSPSTSITAEQLTALQAANIIDGGQAAGSMTLKAFGEKPSIDIPVRIIVKG